MSWRGEITCLVLYTRLQIGYTLFTERMIDKYCEKNLSSLLKYQGNVDFNFGGFLRAKTTKIMGNSFIMDEENTFSSKLYD